jgi:acylglycerol lipase
MGESMGGAVTVAALVDPSFPEINGLILVAPALWGGETMNPLYRTMLWSMAHMMPFTEFTGRDLDVLASDNIPLLRKMGADPLIIKATRADAIYGLVSLMDDAYERVPQLHTHTLLLYGACDEVIPREPIATSITRFSVSPKFIYYPDGFHMLLRDTEGEMVMEDILSWLKDPDSKIPSGSDRHFPPPENSLDHKRCRGLINWSSGSPNRDQKGIGLKP